MEQQITITSKTQSAKNPKCTIYETSNGKMSAWEQAEELNKHMNQLITVDVKENNGFKNILKFINVAVSEEKVGQPTAILTATNNPLLEEKGYRINVAQTAKGHAYFEATIRADTAEDADRMLGEAISVALKHCDAINANEAKPEQAKQEAGQ